MTRTFIAGRPGRFLRAVLVAYRLDMLADLSAGQIAQVRLIMAGYDVKHRVHAGNVEHVFLELPEVR